MILHGNQRGGGKDLAHHLMKPENERVQVHELRGFIANTLEGAFTESYAISKATKCKQHLYSLSINPPRGAGISDAHLADAVDQAEKELGLTGQPRAIIFHDKRGDDGELRRHAHAVWCRIDTNEMKAIHLPYTKYRLRDLSRELHIQHDLKMPKGLMRSADRDPRNFSLEEWQQCKRAGKDVRKTKDIFRDCWAASDSRSGFAHALAEHGFILAQGRRGHIAVDYKGEKYAISKYAGIKPAQARSKLGALDNLPKIEHAHTHAAQQVTDRLKELKTEQRAQFLAKRNASRKHEDRLRSAQEDEEGQLKQDQEKTRQAQQRIHGARLRKGILGFVDRFTGKRKKTLEQNHTETAALHARIERERNDLRHIQTAILDAQRERGMQHRKADIEAAKELKADIRAIDKSVETQRDSERDAFKTKRKCTPTKDRPRRRTRNRDGQSLGR